MALVNAERAEPSRDRLIRVAWSQGALGCLLLVVVTVARWDDTARIVRELGSAELLLPLCILFALVLSLLKFKLTEEIFVSPAVPAYIAFIPIMGVVLASWVAVGVALVSRALALAGIGPTRIANDDRVLELFRLFGLFGTYGLPMLVAGVAYEQLGGESPLRDPTLAAAGCIAVAELLFILINAAVMRRVQRAMSYSTSTSVKLAIVDGAIYLLALPYSILIAYIWTALTYRGLIPAFFTGIVGTIIVRKLAAARTANRQLVQQLSSLSNVAAALSIQCSMQELLRGVYEQCRNVMDTSLFTIALVDEPRNELRYELEVRHGEILPPSSCSIEEGLNGWVVKQGQPLLLRTGSEERLHGVTSVDDGVATESWLGVPMIAQDRVIGVISVQSFRRGAFTNDDLVLLKAVASQTAAAVENATLYGDLETLNAALEERVALRTAELRETNLQVMAADRAKTQFLANMSHELRTPLNSIIGFSNILIDKTRESIAPRLQGFLENIHASGTHLLTLINDILDLAKIEAGKLHLNLETIDVRGTIESVERVIRGVAAEAEVSVLSTVDPRLTVARFDEARFKQLLINLLSNAVKFSPRGAFVNLHGEFLEAAISPLGTDTLRLAVVDRGSGISEEELTKIFDEFYQVEKSKPNQPGTGLGLPLTRRFVDLHHGKIEVASQLGVGTTFTVYLPLAETASLTPVHSTESRSSSSAKSDR